MEQRERRLSAAEKKRYFPRIDWFEGLFDSVLTSFAGGFIVSLPVMIIWKLLHSYSPYRWLAWLPADGSFVIWWIGLPVAVYVFAQIHCMDILWQLKRKRSSCNSVIVERHHIVDAIMVRQMDYGTPAYFVLTDDNRVFFSIFGGDIYDDGWEANPVSVRKADRVRRVYERTLNANTLTELAEAFSGEVITLDRCYTNDLRWDRIASNPQVSWDNIIEKFKLEPIEDVISPV